MAAETAVMAKKKATPEAGSELADETIRVPGDVARMARIISAVRGGPLGKVVGDICRPVMLEMLRQIEKEGLVPKH